MSSATYSNIMEKAFCGSREVEPGEKPSFLVDCPLGRWKYASASLLFHAAIVLLGAGLYMQKQDIAQPMTFMSVNLVAASAPAPAAQAAQQEEVKQLAQITPSAAPTPEAIPVKREKPVEKKQISHVKKAAPAPIVQKVAEAKPSANPSTGTTQDNGKANATIQRITTGSFLTPPPVVYPRRAQQMGSEGIVTVRLFVDEKGGIQKTELAKSSGYAMLDNEVMSKLRLAKLSPLMRDGQPVAGWASWDYKFEIF